MRKISGAVAILVSIALSLPAQAATTSGPPDPPSTFIAVQASAPSAVVVSTTTGSVIRILTDGSLQFTNNGLALTPDGRHIFATWVSAHTPGAWIGELDTSSNSAPAFVAEGTEPAVSPDGRSLAYITDAGKVAVRDLRSGRTRFWDRATGLTCTDWPINSQVAWTGDGRDLVVLPAGPSTAATRSSLSNTAPPCGTLRRARPGNGLVVIDLSAPNPRARYVLFPPLPPPFRPFWISTGGAANGGRIFEAAFSTRGNSAIFSLDAESPANPLRKLVEQSGLITTIDRQGHDVIVANGNGYTWLIVKRGQIVAQGSIPGGEYDSVVWNVTG
jgi:hypothetical protein